MLLLYYRPHGNSTAAPPVDDTTTSTGADGVGGAFWNLGGAFRPTSYQDKRGFGTGTYWHPAD